MELGVLLLSLVFCVNEGLCLLPNRPRLKTEDGNLILESARDRNITFRSKGYGVVKVNGVDIGKSYALIDSVKHQLTVLSAYPINSIIQNLSRVVQEVSSETRLAQTLHNFRNTLTTTSEELTALKSSYRTIRDNVRTLNSSMTRTEGQVLTSEQRNLIRNFTRSVIDSTGQTSSSSSVSDSSVRRIRQQVATLRSRISDLGTLEDRVTSLEMSMNVTRGGGRGSASVSARVVRDLNRLKRRVKSIRRNYRRLKTRVYRDNCQSNPCSNGGTCIDTTTVTGFVCLCPAGYEGINCNEDVNECQEYAGTDIGCQNGATCLNSLGSYSCFCATGWYGVHCIQKTDSCSTSSSTEICGHGTCVPTPKEGHSYTCICDQGWKKAPGHPSCIVDVDECQSEKPPCSHDPHVPCINNYGSFTCGPCPPGFEGNGFVCRDIDECQQNNGGCSLVPRVECINTRPFRRCGPCPPGYTGNGEICTPVTRPCSLNPCHPLATCHDNPHMSSTYYTCTCPPGYAGNGMGPAGCVRSSAGGGSGGGGGSSVQGGNPCDSNPCINGICNVYMGQYRCTCNPGFTGHNCGHQVNPCSSSPCVNGGTCSSTPSSFTCLCPSAYTGDRCQTPNRDCGGRLTGMGGVVEYPGNDRTTYLHNISCAWIITVNRSLVINLEFSSFHLESGSPTCRFDWLQIHDGPRSSSQLIGRFCGTKLPGVNGTINSTHNQLYLWFRSDHSYAGSGFAFAWNATVPSCGGEIQNREHGAINSPGYPGRYPANRDCYWTVSVRYGKRIQLHFATLQIETHPNCSFDFLAVHDGLTTDGALLAKFCSSQLPSPIVSSSSEVLVHFHSDPSVSDTGFHITYVSVPGIPGCGGILTSDKGEFSAPTFSGEYGHNLECEWLIRVHPEERISLNFTQFTVENSRRCVWDFVEVRDGGERESPLIGRYCGRDLPPPVTSTSNLLLVRFKSDYSIAHEGFTAVYIVACGGEYTAPTGELRSPYFPNPYPHNRVCYYTIRQPPGKAIVVNVTAFNLEDAYRNCIYDYLEIYDGLGETSPLMGRYCGPNHRIPSVVTSSLNALYLKFKTDSSVSNRGFSLTYSTVDIRCGGIHHSLTGTINSPNSPDSYPGGTDCRWVINVPPQYVIQVNWHSFSLERHFSCDYDYVEVFDNSTVLKEGARLGSRYCGASIPPVMTSTGNILTIHFHSDSSVNHDGFSASYHALNTDTVCGGHYHMSAGMIQSPNFPESYPNSRSCVWTITVPVNHQIRLNFTHFDLEGREPSCPHDALILRNGALESSPLIKKLCGRNKTVDTIFSHSHQLYLKFKTDSSVTFSGFKIFWEETATGCGGTLTSPTGELSSPGYPQPFHRFANCIWDIRVSKGSKIFFQFIDLDIQDSENCYVKYVEVRDGPKLTSPSIGRFCNNQGRLSFNSSSNVLKIKFQGGWGGSSRRGFRARYRAVCNTKLTGISGVIESPNFPDPYPHMRNCTWVINAPLGNAINASFSHFAVEDPTFKSTSICQYDFVKIKVGRKKDNERSEIGTFCGDQIPVPLFSGPGMDIMEIQFKSDYSVAANGFRLEWVVHGCSKYLKGYGGLIESPNFPNAYPANTHCEWHIKVPVGLEIEIKIEEYDIESSFSPSECIFDSLKVYGGPDRTSPVLLTLCHHERNMRGVTTQGNQALLVLESDGSVRGRGFRASYTAVEKGDCGADLSASQGIIHSKGYPENYDPNSDCLYRLGVNPNHVVQLEFKDFDIETHDNCSYDYLAVYDGLSTNDPLIDTFCGSSLPSPPIVRSSGRYMALRLKSDGNLSGRGFKAEVREGCGATINVTRGLYGSAITSPKFPGPITPHTVCTWHLKAEQGSKIQIRFVHLNLIGTELDAISGNVSCPYDYIKIFDGNTVSSPEVGKFCGTHIPRTMFSTSEYLTIHLQTLRAHGTGFRLLYSSVDTACGGDMYSQSGEFASPFYPDSYPSSFECIWTLNAGSGNRIQLNFERFDIEESEGCNNDYLEVHEGSQVGPLLLHNCSSTTPPSLTATGSFWVKFESDDRGTAGGFLANYVILNSNTLTGPSGLIASPLYPHIFTLVGEYTWTISVDMYKYISFEVLDIAVELDPVEDVCYSSIVIYDGPSRSSEVLRTICGHVPPTEQIVTSDNVAFVRFISNYRHEGSYFNLRYNEVITRTNQNSLQENPAGPHPNCSYTVTVNTRSVITSKNYPDNYDNNMNCEWIIETERHSRLYILMDFELESSRNCIYDKIELYDGVDGTRTWNKTATLCQRRQNRRRYYSSGSVFRIRFTTDSYVTQKGFRATVRKACGGVLTDPDGVITSPRYPSNYMWSRCTWKVKAPLGKTIEMRFDDFRVSNTTPTCRDDYLLIYNGASRSSPYLGRGRYCGIGSIPTIPETSSNNALLIFRANFMNNDKGFHLTYSHLSGRCGGQHRLSSEVTSITIHTPNYPNPPHPHTECVWVVSGPPGKSLKLEFIDTFDIVSNYYGTCNNAYVEVRNGGTNLAQLVRKMCGNTIPNPVYTQDGIMYVRYYTNEATTHSGFKAIVKANDCGGVYRIPPRGVGYLTSLNYPNSYGKDTNCTWVINAPAGHYIIIAFLEINIYNPSVNCSSGGGKLVIHDNVVNSSVTVCGTNVTRTDFETASSNATIVFTNSEQRIRDDGRLRRFRLQFLISPHTCGGVLTGTGGNLTSPGYPHGLPHFRFCHWRIQGPPGSKITFNLDDVDFEHSPSGFCNSFLLVINGDSNFSPWLKRRVNLCRTEGQVTFHSSMNTMKIFLYVFRGGYSSRGLRASWNSDLSQDCGGTLQSSGGVLSSPTFDAGQYNESLYCVWTFLNPYPTNSSINVTFNSLNLLNGCRDEVLLEGYESSSGRKRIWKLCEGEQQRVFIAPFPSLKIHFISRVSLNTTAFNATYGPASCGGFHKGPQTQLMSPGFGQSNYPPNSNCLWLLQFSKTSQVEVEFEEFQLENSMNHDYVKVSNGPTEDSPVIGQYTGSTNPGLVGPSMSNQVLVQFASDSSTSDRGFIATAREHTRGCGGVYHRTSGNISSKGFENGDDYEPNSECFWEVRVEPGYQLFTSFVEAFDLETSEQCQNDFVKISIQNTETANEWTSLGSFCGKSAPPPLQTNSSNILITLRSNEAIQGRGFKLQYEGKCGGNYFAKEGSISSPNHPNNYPRNVECIYNIIADAEAYVVINFTSFNLESGHIGCEYDSLRVQQPLGGSYFGREFLRVGRRTFCGNELPEPFVLRGTVSLNFTSNRYLSYSGFLINYKIKDCGGNVSESSVIGLPTHPGSYVTNMNCIWNVKAPPGEVIYIKFQSLHLEYHRYCEFDYIDIYEGFEESDDKRIVRLCGNHEDDLPKFMTKSSKARIVFRSDERISYPGFQAALQFTHKCGGIVNITGEQSEQSIRSLDVDGDGLYEPFLKCEWLIHGHEERVLALNFTRLDIEGPTVNDTKPCPYDYVQVFDGPSTKSPMVGVYCGSTLPAREITGSRNVMLVIFHSDSVNQSAGFTAKLRNIPRICGPSSFMVTDDLQSLETPNFPSNYPSSLRCMWILTAPENKKIRLHIDDFNLEDSPKCSKDKVYIGELPTGDININSGADFRFEVNFGSRVGYYIFGTELNHEYCGSSFPHQLQSTTNGVKIIFTTDTEGAASGFRLHFSLANCNATLRGESGLISRRYTGGNEGNDSGDCFTTITTNPGKYVSLYVAYALIYSSNNYPLKIYDGTSSSDPMLRQLGNGMRRPDPIYATGNSLHIEFINPPNFYFYSLTYATSDRPNGCGGQFYSTYYVVTSPSYPGIPEGNQTCEYMLSVPSPFHAAINRISFDFGGGGGCNNTYLELYDILPTNEARLFATYCGDDEPAKHMSTSSRLFIRYVIGTEPVTGNGWFMYITRTTPHEDTVFEEEIIPTTSSP